MGRIDPQAPLSEILKAHSNGKNSWNLIEGSSQPQIPGGFEPEEEEPTFPAGMFPQEEEELQYADPQERDSSHSEHTEQHYTGSERSSGSGPTESSNGVVGSKDW